MAQEYRMTQADTMQDYYRAQQQYAMGQDVTMAQDYTEAQDYPTAQDYAAAQDYNTAQEQDYNEAEYYHEAQEYNTAEHDGTAQDQSASLSSNPYRVSVMPDDVPSVDVSEQAWRDSTTHVPEEGQSEQSSLNGTYEEIPSPTVTKEGVEVLSEPANHYSKHVLKKLTKLVKKHSKQIEILTVFTKEGDIVCSHEAPSTSSEQHNYSPDPAEGRYLRLAIELGFKEDGCPFEFGSLGWLSGAHEEVDDKFTLLGSPDGEHPVEGPHQFYGVLSPTGRYVFAAVLREGPSGLLDPKTMRKMRDLADKLEVYEAWAGKGGFMSKIAAKI